MKALIFDTETSGEFAPYNNKWWGTPELQPKLTQLSWKVIELIDISNIDKVDNAISIIPKYITLDILEKDYIIYPKDNLGEWQTTNSDIHGITHGIAQLKGVDIELALIELIEDASVCDYIVAHNIKFDRDNILAACKIAGFDDEVEEDKKALYRIAFDITKSIDTMHSSTKFCALPYPIKNGKRRGGHKWAKLEELYTKLFDTKFENAHNSLYDVRATTKCFIELLNLKVIEL